LGTGKSCEPNSSCGKYFSGLSRFMACSPRNQSALHELGGQSWLTPMTSLRFRKQDQDAIGATLISLLTGFRERDAEKLVGIYTC
jgi:hypothetical protein